MAMAMSKQIRKELLDGIFILVSCIGRCVSRIVNDYTKAKFAIVTWGMFAILYLLCMEYVKSKKLPKWRGLLMYFVMLLIFISLA